MVLKWLAIQVAVYLNSGSPPQDNSQSAGSFTKSKQGDINVGAMFNNFCSHPTVRNALGVHVIETQPEGTYECHEFWHFCALHFGECLSFYLACQGLCLILELCKGDQHNPNNLWQWETVHLNLPGSQVYDPLMPR
jgi:hypothetical protein